MCNIQKDIEQRLAEQRLHIEQRMIMVESNNEMNEKKIDSSTDDIIKLLKRLVTY